MTIKEQINFLKHMLEDGCIKQEEIGKVVEAIVGLAQEEENEEIFVDRNGDKTFLPQSTIKVLKDLYFYADKNKIEPIKSLRELTNLGLKNCKDIVDRWICKW